MTDIEIDKLIKGYHYEIKGCFDMLEGLKELELEGGEDISKFDFSSHETTLRFACFVSSSFIDLLTTLKGINKATTDWEYMYHARIGYLIIYETIKTYHQHKKSIYEIVNSKRKDLFEYFKLLGKLLKDYKNQHDYEKSISKIRNKTIAHFDKDFYEYYKYFEKLNSPESKKAIEDFLEFFKALLHFTFGLNGGKIVPATNDILK
jgi:hypothetical protein